MAENKPGKKVTDFKTNAWQSENQVRVYVNSTGGKPVEETSFSFMSDIYKIHIQPGMRVLDVGCGSGRLTIAMHDHGCPTVGTDVSQSMLDALIKLKGEREIETRCSDGHSIAAEDGEFDAVVSMDYLPHFPNWSDLLTEKARCCKKDGLVLFNFQSQEHRDLAQETGRFNYQHVYSPDNQLHPEAFYAEYNAGEVLEACKRAGLKLLQFHPYGFFWSHYNFLIGNALGMEALDGVNDELRQHFRSPEVREFAFWFERTIIRNLPAFMTHEHVAVCQKI